MNNIKNPGGLREKSKELYLRMWDHGPAINGADVELIEQAMTEVWNEALEAAAQLAMDHGYTLNENSYQPWAFGANMWLRSQNLDIKKKILDLKTRAGNEVGNE